MATLTKEQNLLKQSREALEQASNILLTEPDAAGKLQNIRDASNQAAAAVRDLNVLYGLLLAKEFTPIAPQPTASTSVLKGLGKRDFSPEYQQITDTGYVLNALETTGNIITFEQLRLAYQMAHAVENVEETWEIVVFYDDTSYFFANHYSVGQIFANRGALCRNYLEDFKYSGVKMLSKLVSEEYVKDITRSIAKDRTFLDSSLSIARHVVHKQNKKGI